MNGPSLSRRSLLRGGVAAAGITALAGCTASGASALPFPGTAVYHDVAHVREEHRDDAVEHLRALLQRATPVVQSAQEANVFDSERIVSGPDYLEDAREFLDGRTPPTFDTLQQVRYYVRFVAETFGAAVAGLDDVHLDDSRANVGPAPEIDEVREAVQYTGDDPVETIAWIELAERWLHTSMIAGKNAKLDREELAELDASVRKNAIMHAVRNHERSVRFLSDARQFYRTFRAEQDDPTPIGLQSARATYRKQTAEFSHDYEWYDSHRIDVESESPPPRSTGLNRLMTLRPGEDSLDDADWARSDSLPGLETIRLAEAVASFHGFETGKAAVEQLSGKSSVSGGLLFDTKRRAVQSAYELSTTGNLFEKCLLNRAALYVSKGDSFVNREAGVADHSPKAHALACYGVAVGIVEVIPSVASVLTG
ncbi:protein exported by tat pathway [Halogeometricum borinquense DSM 11551]|uniref:protein EXPORTED by Tat pathway n=2 Tax=Halogeometricum borinquense TaxID=60847 RepID=E4NSV4_HALBP|nr:twin-arginine translocation signal domain-containing protein [Halogeometricum borinquense]ADQ65842.1 protein exported by TAT pathway [Halogeometricum borinquense DSM 11551]ELY26844.1 protein exported by tat pathway [Halogeometricum borinquense DSM 11551]RYJ14888.1 hypothetical protein ELS19_13600 [Halogeometricum borinquense]